ncbi:MAG: CRISPR-associated protein Cas4 [Promethearchaeota archaeon]
MENEDISLKKYKLNKYQLNEIRVNYPKVHLNEMALIGTEEIRQFSYCKRILFFRHIIHAPMKKSYKMEYGTEKHAHLQKYLKNSDEECLQKYFNVYLSDPDTGLVGLIDYFEFNGSEAYPVEIKTGRIPPEGLDYSHKNQIIAQAILIEKNFDFLVKKAKIYYSKSEKIVNYPLQMEDKLSVLKIIGEIRQMLIKEILPKPTIYLGKCIDCECKNYCLRE